MQLTEWFVNVDWGMHDGYDHKVMGHTRTHTAVTGHWCDFVRQSREWNNEWISTFMKEDKVVYLYDREVLKELETLNK